MECPVLAEHQTPYSASIGSNLKTQLTPMCVAVLRKLSIRLGGVPEKRQPYCESAKSRPRGAYSCAKLITRGPSISCTAVLSPMFLCVSAESELLGITKKTEVGDGTLRRPDVLPAQAFSSDVYRLRASASSSELNKVIIDPR